MKKKIRSEWNPKAARRYLITVANDLIEDGMFAAEGGRLLHEAKFAGGGDTHHRFVEVIKQILEWDTYAIVEALDEVYLSRF